MRVLYVNPRAGGAERLEELRDAAAERRIAVRELGEAADDASVIGVAGGDGSLAPVAELALERGLPFVPVPLGTRNHFARDLGLDRDDPVGTLAAFDGPERRVDVGTVNGRLFLNNVSLGIYADVVHQEPDLAPLGRLTRTLLRLRRRPVRLELEGEELAAYLLLVGNNEYGPDGRRERLDAGTLSVRTLERVGRLRVGYERRTGTRFLVGSRYRRLRAAIDGEPVALAPPLEFGILPRALRVRIVP